MNKNLTEAEVELKSKAEQCYECFKKWKILEAAAAELGYSCSMVKRLINWYVFRFLRFEEKENALQHLAYDSYVNGNKKLFEIAYEQESVSIKKIQQRIIICLGKLFPNETDSKQKMEIFSRIAMRVDVRGDPEFTSIVVAKFIYDHRSYSAERIRNSYGIESGMYNFAKQIASDYKIYFESLKERRQVSIEQRIKETVDKGYSMSRVSFFKRSY